MTCRTIPQHVKVAIEEAKLDLREVAQAVDPEDDHVVSLLSSALAHLGRAEEPGPGDVLCRDCHRLVGPHQGAVCASCALPSCDGTGYPDQGYPAHGRLGADLRAFLTTIVQCCGRCRRCLDAASLLSRLEGRQ